MSVTVAGISTIGAKVGYAVSASKPSSLTELERCNSIGGIELSTEQIDAKDYSLILLTHVLKSFSLIRIIGLSAMMPPCHGGETSSTLV